MYYEHKLSSYKVCMVSCKHSHASGRCLEGVNGTISLFSKRNEMSLSALSHCPITSSPGKGHAELLGSILKEGKETLFKL